MASGSFAQIFQHQRNKRLLAFAGRLQKSPGRNINESIGNFDIRRVFFDDRLSFGVRPAAMRNTDNAFKTLRQLNTASDAPVPEAVKLRNDVGAVVGFAKPDVAAIKKNRYRFSAFFSFGKRQSTDLGQKAADIRKRGIQFRRQQGTGFAVDNIAAGRFVKTERNFALTATKSHGGAAAGTVGDKHRLTKGKIRLYAGKNRRNAAVLVSRYCSSDIPRRRQPPQISA